MAPPSNQKAPASVFLVREAKQAALSALDSYATTNLSTQRIQLQHANLRGEAFKSKLLEVEHSLAASRKRSSDLEEEIAALKRSRDDPPSTVQVSSSSDTSDSTNSERDTHASSIASSSSTVTAADKAKIYEFLALQVLAQLTKDGTPKEKEMEIYLEAMAYGKRERIPYTSVKHTLRSYFGPLKSADMHAYFQNVRNIPPATGNPAVASLPRA